LALVKHGFGKVSIGRQNTPCSTCWRDRFAADRGQLRQLWR
jgi:hypothetical protein